MTRIAMIDLGAEYARIFGPSQATGTGRSRLCKVCGDWHSLSKPWPHNCRKEPPPRADLSAPMLAPRFTEFLAGDVADPVMINDARDKRTFMDRHDLVEFDAGVKPEADQTERQWQEELAADFKRVEETDPLNLPPIGVVGRDDLGGAGEIDVSTIEVAK